MKILTKSLLNFKLKSPRLPNIKILLYWFSMIRITSNSKPKRRTIRILIFFSFYLYLSPLSSYGEFKGLGYQDFKKAYKLENTSEKSATVLFYKAIHKGIKKEYRVLAYWHLYTIAKKQKQVDFAYLSLSKALKLKYSKKVKKNVNKLKQTLLKKTKLNSSNFHKYIKGLYYFYFNPSKAYKIWKPLIYSEQNNKFLFKRYLELLLTLDKNNPDQENLQSVSYLEDKKDLFSDSEYYYKRMSLHYKLTKYSLALQDALQLLELQSDEEENKNSAYKLFRFRYTYLLAKIFQKMEHYPRAYLFFRLAANYKSFQDSSLFLASYMQYKIKNYFLAYSIIKNNFIPKRGISALLYHVLRVKLYKKKSSKKYLKKHKKEIKARYDLKPSLLLKRALKYAR